MLILKILGFVLLGIVSLILLLLLLVLFVPVRYNGEFVKSDDDMHGSGKITWFLGIVCIKIKYADKVLEKNGRIAFKKLWKEKPKASEKKNETEAVTFAQGTWMLVLPYKPITALIVIADTWLAFTFSKSSGVNCFMSCL